ncbi:MAG TPA: hypothetical protein VNO21_22935, partial [Polyangiaceae bacterium]|nr:hypothetical protein [Polyangiaceae bacterium]
MNSRLSQADLREDVRQLVRLLEESHPDPYVGGGGRVAFHRRFHELLDEIPAEGLTVREFLHALRPLVASVRDGHTDIRGSLTGGAHERRTWVELDVVEERLYVSGVYREDQRRAIGGRIRSVEGIAWPELIRRSAAFRGYENAYGNIVHLAEAVSKPDILAELLGYEKLPDLVHVDLELSDQTPLTIALPIGSAAPGPVIRPPSRLSLPEPNSAAIGWGFLTEDRSVAILRVDTMMRYREAFEAWRATGYATNLGDRLTTAAEDASGRKAPPGIDERIALIPSATETLEALVTAMRGAKTTTLVVDLRRNEGGNSLLATIFGYFFYSVEQLLETDEGYQIPRFSELYFENNLATSL